VSARFDRRANRLTVVFADGDEAQLDPDVLLTPAIQDVEWWRVASNDHELVVPHADGWVEIPWDVVRAQTDAEFDAHMARHGSYGSERIRSSAD
jgi:hypothetical protein